ncbi:MAG: demethylmenaquinone methyltransferase [Streptococcaceae bacterium]|jgi:demethylmenaquinone methyltransferase/2-methoxy-6-polyprenyl-1,4-benzoquinol methylase|nr:demethylmenaquinone methyltransferase [Streptococcaceae bacterium]
MTTNANPRRVHEIFETISGDYDKMNAIISFGQHDRWRRLATDKISVNADETVLDLCCGTGDWTGDLRQLTKNVLGLDFSENMLAVARARFPEIEFIQGDAMALPFAADSFDAVTIGYGLRNLPDTMAALTEIFRVLKPGGRLVCLETSQPTLPIYKPIFSFYFAHIMPLFGQIFSKHKAEYRWLNKSAQAFPDAKKLSALMKQAGFDSVSYQLHACGAAATHIAHKNKCYN